MATNVIIYGIGSFAKMAKELIERESRYRVVSFCADSEFVDKSKCCGKPLYSIDVVGEKYPSTENKMFVAVGYKSMRARTKMYDKAKSLGYEFINYIHPSAFVDNTTILGDNNFIFMNTSIEPYCVIGNNNIFWSNVQISHDVEIGSHSFFASNSLIGGDVVVEDGCFLGFDATCVQGITIRRESLIGAKTLVLASTNAFTKNIGIPSNVVGSHEKYGIKIT